MDPFREYLDDGIFLFAEAALESRKDSFLRGIPLSVEGFVELFNGQWWGQFVAGHKIPSWDWRELARDT